MSLEIIDLGGEILANLSFKEMDEYEKIKNILADFDGNLGNTEELLSWFVCIVALSAAIQGNYGVGSAIVDNQGELVCYSGNAVFNPRFRSDAHAEMMALNIFEETYMDNHRLSSCVLYTSLESCPMCLTRALNAQVGSVIHISDDDFGGMTRQRSLLPIVWQDLQEGKYFRKANCSKLITEIASQIFLSNAKELKKKLLNY